MYIAHRGKVIDDIEENSISSFKLAINDDRYSGFECDVRESLDNEFIICHDLVYKYNMINHQKSDKLISLGLTTLDEVLSLKTNKIILLEIKDYNINIKKLVDLLNNSNKKIYVMSFFKEVIRKIKQYKINFKIGILNYVFNSMNSYEDYDFICLLNNTITPDIIRYFNKRNIEIFSYGILSLKKKYNNIYYIVDNNANYMKDIDN